MKMTEANLIEYFDKQIEFHTKLHEIAKQAMLESYKDKVIEGVTKWSDIMAEENARVMTLMICKRDLA